MIWKIYVKWLATSIGIGLIPLLILGASPGGIALSPTFSGAECNYTYEYESPTSRYQFVISDYGKVHTWDYAAHK
jgi:hypothetical protein